MRRTFLLAGLLIFSNALWSQVRYDVLLKGGHVIDPENRIDQVMDVAIAQRKIARVAANIPEAEAKQVINVPGLFVTPGLVDMHIHAYASTGVKGEYNGDRSLYPDGYTLRNGVTTAVDAGFLPDSISTDLHTGSMNAGMKSMNNLMSKVLSLGVPLAKVIELTTISPALVIKRPELGHLSVGAGADVAVFRVDQGQFGFLDSRRARFTGTQMLVCELTLRDGAVEWDLNGRAGEDWKVYYKVKK